MSRLKRVAVVLFYAIPPTNLHERFLVALLKQKKYDVVYIYFHGKRLNTSFLHPQELETQASLAFAEWMLSFGASRVLKLPTYYDTVRPPIHDLTNLVVTAEGTVYVDLIVDSVLASTVLAKDIQVLFDKHWTVYRFGEMDGETPNQISSKMHVYPHWYDASPGVLSLHCDTLINEGKLTEVLRELPNSVARFIASGIPEDESHRVHFDDSADRGVASRLRRPRIVQ